MDGRGLTDSQRSAWLDGLAAGPVYAAATIVITRLTRPQPAAPIERGP
jgi:hypothetical protein